MFKLSQIVKVQFGNRSDNGGTGGKIEDATIIAMKEGLGGKQYLVETKNKLGFATEPSRGAHSSCSKDADLYCTNVRQLDPTAKPGSKMDPFGPMDLGSGAHNLGFVIVTDVREPSETLVA